MENKDSLESFKIEALDIVKKSLKALTVDPSPENIPETPKEVTETPMIVPKTALNKKPIDILNPTYRSERIAEQFAHRPFERLSLWKDKTKLDPSNVDERLGTVIKKSFLDYSREKLSIENVTVRSSITSYETLHPEYAKPYGLNILSDNGTLGLVTLEE